MNMEFCYTNYFNTTTMMTLGSGSTTVEYLFDRNRTTQYQSSGKNDDTQGVTLGVIFPASRNINRIVLQNINLKSFKLYYSSNAANVITLTTTCGTNSSSWATNSNTSLFLIFPTTAMTSIWIDGTITMVANEEKKIGELWALNTYLKLDYNPSAKEYTPKLERREQVHEMVDGGWSVYQLGDNFSADIKLTYQSASMTSSLHDLYNFKTEFVFIPFPTGTGWTGMLEQIYEVNWIGDFEFYDPADDNYTTAGYNGRVRLRETP